MVKEKSSKTQNIKIGVVMPPQEYNRVVDGQEEYNVDLMKEKFTREWQVKFLAEQMKGTIVPFNVVETKVFSEATAAILDELISNNMELNEDLLDSEIYNIVHDLGGGTQDICITVGTEVLDDTERTYKIGVNDALEEIAEKVAMELGPNVVKGTIDRNKINFSIRYETPICSKCGSVINPKSVGEDRNCPKCGEEKAVHMKKNIFRYGNNKYKDITEIVNKVFEEHTDSIASQFKTYFDTQCKERELSRLMFGRYIAVGGGAELYGDMVMKKIKPYLSKETELIKSPHAVFKNLDGVGKYLLYENGLQEDADFIYALLDIGNSSAKARLMSADGNQIGKPIELFTKTAIPTDRTNSSIKLSRKQKHPMSELYVDINGLGKYFIGPHASKGKLPKVRKTAIDKAQDEVTYIMATTVIACLLERLNEK